jgi:3',5'-cyclic AMP phosphodiesterase CpdA
MIKRRHFIASLSALTAAPAFAGRGSGTVRFVQITDTHFGQRNHDELTDKIIKQVNKLPMAIDFAVHTGDIMNNTILTDAAVNKGLEVMSGLKVPVHYVPGNHDILRKNHEPTRSAFERQLGKLHDVHEYNGLVLVTIYTEPLAGSFKVPGFDPLTELENSLRKLRGKSIVVAHHSPCVGNFYNNREYKGWPAGTRDRWITLLNKYHVKGVIAGHFHRDEMFWLDQVPLHICPPVSLSWGRQPAYRIFIYENGKLNYRTQYLG